MSPFPCPFVSGLHYQLLSGELLLLFNLAIHPQKSGVQVFQLPWGVDHSFPDLLTQVLHLQLNLYALDSLPCIVLLRAVYSERSEFQVLVMVCNLLLDVKELTQLSADLVNDLHLEDFRVGVGDSLFGFR